MKYLISITIVTISIILANGGTMFEGASNNILNKNVAVTPSEIMGNPASEIKLLLTVDGVRYEMNTLNDKESYIMLYTKDSDMNHDANIEIVSVDKTKRLTVIIDGLQGKGKEFLSGKVKFEDNASLVSYKEGELQIHFTEGDFEIGEVSKTSGKIKLKAAGRCTIKKGNSFKDMRVDVPAQLEMEAIINDIKTSDYKK